MNNAAYMQLFEEARWDALSKIGIDKSIVDREKAGPVLIEAHIFYKKEVGANAQISIETQFINSERKLFQVHQEMKGPDGVVSSEAQFKLGLFSTVSRKLISPPDYWLQAMKHVSS